MMEARRRREDSLNHYWGDLNGIADIRKESLGRRFIFITSSLPHSDKVRTVHLFISTLIAFNIL